MTDEVNIRPATVAEEHIIISLLREVAADMQKKGIEQWIPEEFTSEKIQQWLRDGDVLLAFWQNKPAGCVALTTNPDHLWATHPSLSVYLSKLAVDIALRGTGISQKLLRVAEDWAAHRNIYTIRLDCWAGNVHLRKFYTEQGYSLIAIAPEETWQVALFEKQFS